MGLDITAYEKLTTGDRTQEDLKREYEKGWTPECRVASLYINDDFPGRADPLTTGYYLSEGEVLKFLAGSYSGYSHWRSTLAQMIGRTDEDVYRNPTGPFAELINFSDCEGVIGPAVSAKIAQDFDDHRDLASAIDYDDFARLYELWSEAFHLAAKGGAVDFH